MTSVCVHWSLMNGSMVTCQVSVKSVFHYSCSYYLYNTVIDYKVESHLRYHRDHIYYINYITAIASRCLWSLLQHTQSYIVSDDCKHYVFEI